MIKCVVLREFRDRDNFAKTYKEGDVVPFTTDRFKKLVSLGLVKAKAADKVKENK